MTRAIPEGVSAVLRLVLACVAPRGGSDDEWREAHALFAAAGLGAALGQLCMLLPSTSAAASDVRLPSTADAGGHGGGGGGTHGTPLRLVLRLLTDQMQAAPTGGDPTAPIEAQAALEAQAATHHAVAALLRLRAAPPASAANAASAAADADADAASAETPPRYSRDAAEEGAALTLDLLSFLNAVVTLHAETVDTVAGNAVLVPELARLAIATRGGGGSGGGSGGADIEGTDRIGAAACLLLAHMLRTLALESHHRQPSEQRRRQEAAAPAPMEAAAHAEMPPRYSREGAAPSSAARRSLVGQLCCELRLGTLLAGMRSPHALRRAATLHLAAELCDCGGLDAPGAGGAHEETWGVGLLNALLHAAASHEEIVLQGLRRLTASLACCPSRGVGDAFQRLADHPWPPRADHTRGAHECIPCTLCTTETVRASYNRWHLFLLELHVAGKPSLPPPLCAYWSLVLEARPAWTHEAVLHKPALVRELVALALNAAPFGGTELRLLGALKALSAISPPLAKEAVRLLRFRARDPSAARWRPAAAHDDPAATDGARAPQPQAGAAASAHKRRRVIDQSSDGASGGGGSGGGGGGAAPAVTHHQHAAFAGGGGSLVPRSSQVPPLASVRSPVLSIDGVAAPTSLLRAATPAGTEVKEVADAHLPEAELLRRAEQLMLEVSK